MSNEYQVWRSVESEDTAMTVSAASPIDAAVSWARKQDLQYDAQIAEDHRSLSVFVRSPDGNVQKLVVSGSVQYRYSAQSASELGIDD